MMSKLLSTKQFAVHVKPLVAGGMCAARAGPRTPRPVSTARLLRAGTVSMCEAARATVVWTELLLLVQRAEAEHAAWVDTCHALRHLDWSQQLHTAMTALRLQPKPSSRSCSGACTFFLLLP